MEVIQRNKLRMRKLAATNSNLSQQVETLDWEELETALMECIFKKDETGLPESYGPASYFPLIPENSRSWSNSSSRRIGKIHELDGSRAH